MKTITSTRKFYRFNQTNSGGSWRIDEKLCHEFYIEAINRRESIQKAESFGCYWGGVSKGIDCNCCGDRWYKPSDMESFPLDWEGSTTFETIEEYLEFLTTDWDWRKLNRNKVYRIFYINGDVKEYTVEL